MNIVVCIGGNDEVLDVCFEIRVRSLDLIDVHGWRGTLFGFVLPRLPDVKCDADLLARLLCPLGISNAWWAGSGKNADEFGELLAFRGPGRGRLSDGVLERLGDVGCRGQLARLVGRGRNAAAHSRRRKRRLAHAAGNATQHGVGGGCGRELFVKLLELFKKSVLVILDDSGLVEGTEELVETRPSLASRLRRGGAGR